VACAAVPPDVQEMKDKGTFTYAADAISHAEAGSYMAKNE
jgi:hypothetical protein